MRSDRMKRPNLVRDRFLRDLDLWLTPGLVYHCLTGENDPMRIAHVDQLDPSLLEPLLNKAMRQWPERLQRIAADRQAEREQSKAAVHQFVFSIGVDAPHRNQGQVHAG